MNTFTSATDLELEQYILELGFWRVYFKNRQLERFDFFELFKNELPEVIEEKLKELKPKVKHWAEVLLMADEKMKMYKKWFWRSMFKIWVYDEASSKFQKYYKELKRFYWLERRLNGDNFKTGMTPEEFKEKNPVWETIALYVPISPRGFAKCPFHSEKTASLKVYKDHWYCFGCNEYGDTISFLIKIHNLTFQEILN